MRIQPKPRSRNGSTAEAGLVRGDALARRMSSAGGDLLRRSRRSAPVRDDRLLKTRRGRRRRGAGGLLVRLRRPAADETQALQLELDIVDQRQL